MNRLLLFMLAVVFASCSTTIQSNKSKDFNEKIKKFYAVIKVADNSGNFVPGFSKVLQEGLTKRGVEIQFDVINPLALENEQDLVKRISESKADALLIVSQTESVTYASPGYNYGRGERASGGSFDVKIFVPGNDRPVWRGLMKSSTGGYGSIGVVAKTSAESIIQRLIEDGMI